MSVNRNVTVPDGGCTDTPGPYASPEAACDDRGVGRRRSGDEAPSGRPFHDGRHGRSCCSARSCSPPGRAGRPRRSRTAACRSGRRADLLRRCDPSRREASGRVRPARLDRRWLVPRELRRRLAVLLPRSARARLPVLRGCPPPHTTGVGRHPSSDTSPPRSSACGATTRARWYWRPRSWPVRAAALVGTSGRMRRDRTTALVATSVFSLAAVGVDLALRSNPTRTVRSRLLVFDAALCAVAVLLSWTLRAPKAVQVTDLVVELRRLRRRSLGHVARRVGGGVARSAP